MDNKTFDLKPSPPCARMGWISPRGEFFPCAYQAHRSLGSLLVTKYLDGEGLVYPGPVPVLERNGWVLVCSSGITALNDHYAPSVGETLRKIVESFEFEQLGMMWDVCLKRNPEGYEVESEGGCPTQFMAEATFPKQLRKDYNLFFGEGISDEDLAEFDAVVPRNPLETLSRRVDDHPGD